MVWTDQSITNEYINFALQDKYFMKSYGKLDINNIEYKKLLIWQQVDFQVSKKSEFERIKESGKIRSNKTRI